eukprot:1999639-Rhodomonas_salina.1
MVRSIWKLAQDFCPPARVENKKPKKLPAPLTRHIHFRTWFAPDPSTRAYTCRAISPLIATTAEVRQSV